MKRKRLVGGFGLFMALMLILPMIVNAATPQISAGVNHTLGLMSDGTVVATGSNNYDQCDVGLWSGIIEIAAGDYHTVGLKEDGSVLATGFNDDGQCDVDSWTEIVHVAAGAYYTVGLKEDGTVVATGNNGFGQCDVESWAGVNSIVTGAYHTVGIKNSGTFLTNGHNDFGQCDINTWLNVVSIGAGGYHTIGVKGNGTIVAVGDNDDGQCDLGAWVNVLQVDGGYYHSVGLQSDGSALAEGDNLWGQCDVDTWNDLFQIAAGSRHTVGLKNDGSVIATGYNLFGQCDTNSWDLGEVACSFNILPSSQNYSSEGGTGTIAVFAPGSCSWTAGTDENWIHITSGQAGSGNGLVGYTIDQNRRQNTRTGSIDVAGKVFAVTQDGNLWQAAYDAIIPSDENLKLLREYRDNILKKNFAGGIFVKTLYGCSESVFKVLMDDPELISRARDLVESNMIFVKKVLAHKNAVVSDTLSISAFIAEMAEKSPPALRKLLNTMNGGMMECYEEGRPFFGFQLK